MRVTQTNSSVQSSAGSEAASTQRASKAKAAEQSKKTDRAQAPSELASQSVNTEISSKAKDFARAKAVAETAPDVREDRIAELKKKIAAGQYKVDSKAIADKMVDDHLSSGIG